MKSVATLLATSAMALVFGLSQAQAAEMTLRSADVHPDGYPTTEAVKYMGELLAKKTNGRIAIQIFTSGQLGDEKDTFQQTQFGVLEMDRINLAALNNIIPETRVLALPFMFESVDHMHKVVDGPIGEELMKKFEAHGVVGLAYYDSGARSFYNSQRPIKSLDDVKGLKLRVQQSDLFVDMVRAMGGNPTPMPFGEVYSGLQTGVVDGAENNWPSYQSTHHYEVAKYYTLTEHTMAPEVLVMSKKVFDKLSKDDQAAVRATAKESVAKMRELWAKKEKEAEAIVRAAGSEVLTVDKAPFIKAVEPVYAKYVTDPAMKDLVARIRAAK